MAKSPRRGKVLLVTMCLMSLAYIGGTTVEFLMNQLPSRQRQDAANLESISRLEATIATLQNDLRMKDLALKEAQELHKSAIEWVLRLEGEKRLLAATVNRLSMETAGIKPALPPSQTGTAQVERGADNAVEERPPGAAASSSGHGQFPPRRHERRNIQYLEAGIFRSAPPNSLVIRLDNPDS